jgi:L-threonylcarbamoyladenylate synthase
VGVESTIVDLTDPSRPKVLRPGSVTASELATTLGVKVRRHSGTRAGSTKAGLLAPGMLSQHYSPRTRLVIKTNMDSLPSDCAGVYLRKPSGRCRPQVYWLSRRASLKEIAHNLYGVLRAADHGGHREIWMETLPENLGELAVAINDRIRRAAARGASRTTRLLR